MHRSPLRIGLSGLAIAAIGILVGYRFGASQTSVLEEGLLVVVAIVVLAALVPGLRSRSQSHMAPAEHVAGPERSWDQFRRELDRSRRFGRTFVIARIPAGEVMADGTRRTPHARLAMLPLLVRSIDQIWYSRGIVYVVLPETDREGMRSFLHRLQAAAPGLLPVVGIGVAQFPEDGLTTGALIRGLAPERLPSGAGGNEPALARDLQAS